MHNLELTEIIDILSKQKGFPNRKLNADEYQKVLTIAHAIKYSTPMLLDLITRYRDELNNTNDKVKKQMIIDFIIELEQALSGKPL